MWGSTSHCGYSTFSGLCHFEHCHTKLLSFLDSDLLNVEHQTRTWGFIFLCLYDVFPQLSELARLRHDLRQLLGVAQQLEPFIRTGGQSGQQPAGAGAGSGNTVSFEVTPEKTGRNSSGGSKSRQQQQQHSARPLSYYEQQQPTIVASTDQGLALTEEYKRR